jgi:hypothetical protein
MRQRLTALVLAVLTSGCTAVAASVVPGQLRVPDDSGIAMGRLAFINQHRKIAVQRFELAAVQVPGGRKFKIQFGPDSEPEDGGSFFVTLPAGQYRLVEWMATAGDHQWAGDDVGLSMEVVAGRVVCVGSLFVRPQEHRRFTMAEELSGDTKVRDECPALTELLRQRSPALAEEPVVRIARRVANGRDGS